MSDPSMVYWASEPNEEQLVRNCVARRKAFQELQQSAGVVDKAALNWRLYLGIDEDGVSGKVWRDQKNELARIFVNHLRANTRIILQYTTGQPPTWDCQSADDDPSALEATKIGDQLLDFFWETERVDEHARLAAELALVMKSAFLLCEWDETAGKSVGVIDDVRKLLRYEGGLHFAALTPWQVVFDPLSPTPFGWPWVMWGELKSKWDLASIYFDRREKILQVGLEAGNGFYRMEYGIENFQIPNDFIWQWTLVHLPTKGCTGGRFLRWVGDDTPLVVGPCPEFYLGGNNRRGRLPVHRLVHSETPTQPGTPTIITGHSPVDDGAPLQQALNSEISTILTNHAKFGRWKWKGRLGDCLNIMELADGDVLQTEGDLDVVAPPGSADLVATAQEYISQMSAVMGVAEASRGIAPSNETAALSLALQDSSTVTNNRGFDLNYRSMLQETANAIIEILQVVADRPQVVTLIGEGGQGGVLEFTRESLQPISRVLVVPASPMLRLNSGRIGFLETILAKFPTLVHNEAEILTALETGNFRRVFKGNDEQLSQAHDENERMRGGERIEAQVHEHHILHIKTHIEDIGRDPATAKFFLTHIGLHLQQFAQPSTQALMVVLGYMRPDEIAAYQSILGMAAGGMPMGGGMPPGAGGPPSPGGPPAQTALPEPMPEGNVAPAEQTMAAGQEFLESRAAASPMNAAANQGM